MSKFRIYTQTDNMPARALGVDMINRLIRWWTCRKQGHSPSQNVTNAKGDGICIRCFKPIPALAYANPPRHGKTAVMAAHLAKATGKSVTECFDALRQAQENGKLLVMKDNGEFAYMDKSAEKLGSHNR